MYLTAEAIKQLMQNSVKSRDAFSADFMDVPSLMKEGSYLFYEFEDKAVVKDFDSNHPEYGTYTKYISPLFAESVINNKSNTELLSIITEETPFYHLEPSLEVTVESEPLSLTRDPGINDVPSPLQDSNFYNTWFRESQGYIQNYILLDVYNKLRWPFINENQYLNATLFPYLASKAFNASEDKDSLIEFRDSLEENIEDNNFYEGMNDSERIIPEKNRVYSKVGCIDYLNDIVNQKLTSTYSFVDYDPEQSNLLSDWSESLYEAGMLPFDEISTQTSVYKLQDLKYELLRRKFAGSSTLYKIALASIGRQGSFVSTTPVGSLATSSSVFKDKRLIRLLNIPGILSQYADLTDIDPITTYFSTPYEEDGKYIPLDTLIPLFYTSAPQGSSDYSAESFYTGSNLQTYRNLFLRDNNTVIEWTAPASLISTESINTVYPTLDEKIASSASATGFRYRTLDDVINKSEEDASAGTMPLYLDRKRPIISSSLISGNVLDISANKFLFNKNTVQKDLGDAYPYLTYPIASNNSVSLMDIPWMEYLISSTEKKSRVQDNVAFGVQLSRYEKLDPTQCGRYTFFGISYGIDTEDEDGVEYSALTLPKSSYEDTLRIKASISDVLNRKCDDDEVAVEGRVYYIRDLETPTGYIAANPQPEVGEPVGNYYTLPYFYKRTGNSYEITQDIHEQENIYSLYIKEDEDYIACKDILETEYPRFVYLWYCVLKYSVNEFQPLNLSTTLISRITLRVPSESKYSEEDAYKELIKFNEGVLPFTYPEMKDDKVLSLKLGVYNEIVIDKDNKREKIESLYDDLSHLNYSKAMFVFSTSDIVKNTELLDTSPESVSSSYLSLDPSADVKAIFYAVYKGASAGTDIYKWSEPVKVVTLTDAFVKSLNELSDDAANIYPDWYNLGYYLNPYLNFTINSASALRHKVAVPSKDTEVLDIPDDNKETILTGPSENVGLSNLTRVRGYECTCNDDGRATLPMMWIQETSNEDAQDIYGFYLNRYHPTTEAAVVYPEFVQIYGDNREADIFDDVVDELSSGESRSVVRYDSFTKMPCLEFKAGSATEDNYPVAENYLRLLPTKAEYVHTYVETRTRELQSEIEALELKVIDHIEQKCPEVPDPGYPVEQTEERINYQINWILNNTVISKNDVVTGKTLRTADEQKAIRMNEDLSDLRIELSHVSDVTDEEKEKEVWSKWWWNRPSEGITVCANIMPRNGSGNRDTNDLLTLLEQEGSACIIGRVNSSPAYYDLNVLPYTAEEGTYYRVLHEHESNPEGYYTYDEDSGWIFSETAPVGGTYGGVSNFYNTEDRTSFEEEVVDSEFSLDLVKKTAEDVIRQLDEAEADEALQEEECSLVHLINDPQIALLKDTQIPAEQESIASIRIAINAKNEELTRLNEDFISNQNALEIAEYRLEGATSTEEQQAEWLAEIEVLTAELAELTSRKSTLEKEIDDLNVELENTTDEARREEIIAEIAEKREELDEVNSEITTKQSNLDADTYRIEGITYIAEDLEVTIEELEETLQTIEENINVVIGELAELNEDLDSHEENLRDLQLTLATLEKEIDDIENLLASTRDRIIKLTNDLEELRNHAIVNIIFSFYPYGNSTKEVWTIESDDILIHATETSSAFPDYNLRIAASTKTEKTLTGAATTVSLVVNNKEYTPIVYNTTKIESSTLKHPEGSSYAADFEEGEFLPGYPVKYYEGSNMGGIDVACHAIIGVTHRGENNSIYINALTETHYRWDESSESYREVPEDDIIEVIEDPTSRTMGLPTNPQIGKIYKLVEKDIKEEIVRTRYFESFETTCETIEDYTQLEIQQYAASRPNLQQKNRYLGNLFDLRLYNEGITGTGLRMVSMGTTRELFSYSPTSFKLGYGIYEDVTIFKEVAQRPVDVNLASVNSIRLFNRSIWDSILVDMYPVSEEESDDSCYQSRPDYMDPQDDLDIYGVVNGEKTLKDCIEQVLEGAAEVTNGASPITSGTSICRINYNNELHDINATDIVSIISTTLYPVVYNKDTFISTDVDFEFLDEAHSILATKIDHEIDLPAAVDPVDGVLSYDADVSLNWTISPESDFSIWYSHGNHIALNYNSVLDATTAVYSVAGSESSTSASSNSQTNHILIPLTVPRQIDIESGVVGYFDRLNLKGVQVNDGLTALLRATSYYNELRIPVRCSYRAENGQISYRYASKWDAIRLLKEGTYYVTCKYPFQLLPFADYLYDINANKKYASLYATVRFKVEVYGDPVTYQTGRNGAEDIRNDFRSEYYGSNIINHLKSSSALINPLDNRSFPHRNINIDLYVQEVEGAAGRMKNNNLSGDIGSAVENYTFTWKLLGTNHPDDFNNNDSLIYLTEDALKDGLVLKQDVPLFFSKNYTAPFFIAKAEKTSSGTLVPNSASADDDLIEPIRINPRYGTSKIITYVPASGVAIAGTIYYSDANGTIADPQPNYETNDSVEGYYTRVENLDNLEASTEDGLDNLIIVAGRSYKLLWDYTGNISEFSFTDNVYGLESDAQKELIDSEGLPTYVMTNSEKLNFSRLVNILDSSNKSEYMYTTDGLDYSYNDLNISDRLNGYYIEESEYHETTVYRVFAEPTPEELIEDYGADTGYRECMVLDYNEHESQVGEPDIIYLDKTDPSEYKYYIYRDNAYERTYPEPLDVSTVGTIGTYYIYYPEPEKVYTAIISLNDVAFLLSDTYYTWNYIEYNEAEVHSVTEYGYLPYPGVTNDLYEEEATGKIYKCINALPHFIDVSAAAARPFCFGNPYSKSSEHNYLLRVRNVGSAYSRFNLGNSYYFPYVPTEVPESDTTVKGHIITGKLPAIKSSVLDAIDIDFNEYSVIRAQYNYMQGILNAGLSNLTNNTAGIFTALSKVYPKYSYATDATTVVAENSYVRAVSDTLHTYYASDRVVSSKNTDILITRRGLYSNNLLTNQDFDNNSAWHWRNYTGAPYRSNVYTNLFVSDADWDRGQGKDVCELKYSGLLNDGDLVQDNSEDPLMMEYSAGSTLISAAYESAISVKILPDEDYEEKFYRWVASSSSYQAIDDEDIIEPLNGLLPEIGQENKLYLFKATSSAYIWQNGTGGIAGGYFAVPMEMYDSSVEGDAEKVYVDNVANLADIYICYMHNNTVVGVPYKLEPEAMSQSTSQSMQSKAIFPDYWYVFSKELADPVRANHVAFLFVCHGPVTLRFTKAVIRKSESSTHALGLSDGLYTRSTSNVASNISIPSHRIVVFQNNTTKELLPIQFNNLVHNRPGSSTYDGATVSYADTGLSSLGDFTTRYSLGFPTEHSKLETLYMPWTRRMHYKRAITSNFIEGYLYDGEFWEDVEHSSFIERDPLILYKDLSTGYYYEFNVILETYEIADPFEGSVNFTGYESKADRYGVKSRVENPTPKDDMYKSATITYERNSSSDKRLAVNSLVINTGAGAFLNTTDTNMRITSEYIEDYNGNIIASGPITLQDETLSMMTNCFNSDRYREGTNTVVTATNIQLMSAPDDSSDYESILYELEFMPIIYDEMKHHFSANVFIHKQGI